MSTKQNFIVKKKKHVITVGGDGSDHNRRLASLGPRSDAGVGNVSARGPPNSKVLLRFKDLKARNVVENWPQLKRLVDLHGFPPGRLLGVNTRVWTEAEIDAWLESRPVSREELEIAS